MNVIDLLIVVLVIIEVVRGFEIGLFRQFCSLAGFWGGLLVGGLVAPLVLTSVQTAGAKLWLLLLIVFGSGLALGALGEWAGLVLANLAHRLRLGTLDRWLGGALGGVMVVVFVWLGSAMLANTPSDLSQLISRSRIVRALDSAFPPAPPYLAKIQRLLTPNGFPQVFVGLEPVPSAPANPASSADVDRALKAAGESVVKLESPGCNGVIDGSGFVAADGIVVTNAHVVAGIQRPVVVDRAGRHIAETIYFDPDMDLAVLRTKGLAGAPLGISSESVPRGTAAVVLGYPGGGPLTGVPAAVLAERIATGRNIYDRGFVTRTIYELQADVRQGNSGGPLVTPDGVVIGVIFAKAQNNSNIGYSLVSGEVLTKVRQAQANSQPVSTGPCLSH